MKLGAGLGLFLVSAAALALELLQVRVFAYSLELLSVYTVISLASLGFGASATLLALLPRGVVERGDRNLPGALTLAAAVSVTVAHVVLAAASGVVDRLEGLAALSVLAALTVPYFLLGGVVAILLRSAARRIFAFYFLNLAGSGLGCFVVFPLLPLVGAEALTLLLGFCLALTALVFGPSASGVRMGALLAAAAHLLLLPLADSVLSFPPDATGHVAMLHARLAEHEGSMIRREVAWDATGKVEVHEVPGEALVPERVECRVISRDGSAVSVLLGVREDALRARTLLEDSILAAGHRAPGMRPGDREGLEVLLLGLHGNADLLTAHRFGARKVVVVEENRAAVDIVGGPYRSFAGGVLARPGVVVEVRDRRGFLRSTRERFDLIQVTSADTRQVFSRASLAVRPELDFTVEAFGEMLRVLRPGGLVCVVRLDAFCLARATRTALAALRGSGAEDPHRHVIALRQGAWTALLVKREPFTTAEEERLMSWAGGLDPGPERTGRIRLPPYDLLDVGLDHPIDVIAGERLVRWLDEQPAMGAFVTDDKPFFFDSSRRRDLFSSPLPDRAGHVRTFVNLLAQIALLATASILLPLVFFRSPAPPARMAAHVAYFAALGAGFILLEVGLMQKFILFLGHTTMSIAVVLLALLVTAGVGSLIAPAFGRDPVKRIRRASAAVLCCMLLYAALLDRVFAAASGLSFAARVALSFALLAPPGIALGIPFPSALHAATDRGPLLFAWALGLNGFAAVIGSVLCLPFSMLFGFRATLLLAAGLYLVPLLLARPLIGAVRERRPPTSPVSAAINSAPSP